MAQTDGCMMEGVVRYHLPALVVELSRGTCFGARRNFCDDVQYIYRKSVRKITLRYVGLGEQGGGNSCLLFEVVCGVTLLYRPSSR